MKARWIGIATAALVVACVPLKQKQIVRMDAPFDEEAHAPYLRKGAHSVKGQAFLLQRGGGNVTCAGRPVLMLPDTPYFFEGIQIAIAGGTPEWSHKPPPQFASVKKDTVCDAQGNFEFDSVPPGKWLVMTEATWVVGNARQGGSMLKRIQVFEGQTGRIFLTDPDRIGR